MSTRKKIPSLVSLANKLRKKQQTITRDIKRLESKVERLLSKSRA